MTHFEIYAEEPATLAEFYRRLFGWRMECTPDMNYWRIYTGAMTTPGFTGGLTHRPIAGTRGWVHYVHVASLDQTVTEAERLGAAVLRPRTAISGTAWYAVLADPEGNIFGIYQNDLIANPLPRPE